MMYYFDIYGWLTDLELSGRSTEIAPDHVPADRVNGEPWPNWTGESWVMRPYAEPAPSTGPVTAEPRRITVGAFFDRFGPLKWEILADQSPQVRAVVLDASVRAYIDLENADLPAGLAILIAAGHPIDAEAIIDNPVQEHERA